METHCCSASASTKNTKTGHKNFKQAAPTSETSRPPNGFDLSCLPAELRINILSYVLAETSEPSGIISINPHARKFVLKGGNIIQDDNPKKQLTQWRARRGILQACHMLREEALELLYNQNTFFASMNGLCALYPMCYERRRFSRWLKIMGGDAEARRIKRMVFAVSWPSIYGRNGWKKRRADVNVCVLRNKVRVELSPSSSDKPMAALVDVEKLIEGFLRDGNEGQGLNRDEWVEIWDEIADFVCCQYDSSDL